MDVAFITIGDPGIYSTYFYLHDRLLERKPSLTIEIVPGISSINAAAARAGLSLGLGNDKIAILPANYLDSLQETLEKFDTVVLMKVSKVFDTVRDTLTRMNLADAATFVARAGMDDERIRQDITKVTGGRPELFFPRDREETMKTNVYFVGAGPGDPELITVKGRKALDNADVVIYAGSLVNPALLDGIKAEIFDSAKMDLDEIVAVVKKAVSNGRTVVRLHTGDTSFYSAISEQIERLRELNIPYAVIPGVSSAMAGAAILGQELTIPEISQTVIFTRMEGRTPVPASERLGSLASHRATMAIFLSVGMIEKVRDELLQGYAGDTPVVVIEKATWPEQKVIRGALQDLASLVKDAGIRKTALIYVGESLRASEMSLGKESKLYHKDFKHEYRK